MAKFPVTYVTKCLADVISIKHKTGNFEKKFSIMLLASKAFYFHQCSADFTYFRYLAGELFLPSRLTFHENGPVVCILEGLHIPKQKGPDLLYIDVVGRRGRWMYNETLPTWLNVTAIPKFREVRSCGGRGKQAIEN